MLRNSEMTYAIVGEVIRRLDPNAIWDIFRISSGVYMIKAVNDGVLVYQSEKFNASRKDNIDIKILMDIAFDVHSKILGLDGGVTIE